MKPLLAALLFTAGTLVAGAQGKCPDPAVTDVGATEIKSRGAMARYRFFVTVTNVGSGGFKTAPGSTVMLRFSDGKARRVMATQPLPDLAAGEVTTLVFEADVDRAKGTLPDWDNLPFPTEICGMIDAKPGGRMVPECDPNNNRLCRAP